MTCMTFTLTAGGTIGRRHLNPPEVCDLCKASITTTFYDARLPRGAWANLCPECFAYNDCNVGKGFGQEYQAQTQTPSEPTL